MATRSIEHPVWGTIEVLQDGGSWILCQVQGEAKKVSKAWLQERRISVGELFKEAEAPLRRQRVLPREEEVVEEDVGTIEEEGEAEWDELVSPSEEEEDPD